MLAHPCGCSLALKAQDADEDSRDQLREAAGECQDGWRCPFAGHPEPDPRAGNQHLPAKALHVIQRVKELTGYEACGTCPQWAARQPWTDRVAEAWRLAEWGQLDLVEPEPSGLLIDGLLAFDMGVKARRAEDHRRLMAEIKSKGGGGK
jgi:hypothetical protein